jgi:hypothetical protein
VIHMRVKGTVDFRELDVEAMDELLPRMREAVRKGVDLLHAKATDLLSRQGSPRTSSPAGEPPEMDSGALMRSLRKRHPGKAGKRRVRGWVDSKHPSALAHEVGSRRVGSGGIKRVPARPFMRPAIAAVEPAVLRIFEEL